MSTNCCSVDIYGVSIKPTSGFSFINNPTCLVCHVKHDYGQYWLLTCYHNTLYFPFDSKIIENKLWPKQFKYSMNYVERKEFSNFVN